MGEELMQQSKGRQRPSKGIKGKDSLRVGKLLYPALFIASAVMVLIGTNEISSTTNFCISCHAMKPFYAAMTNSVHYLKSEGNITCSQCHLPVNILERYPYKLKSGLKDIYKNMTVSDLSRTHFDAKVDSRSDFIFDEACLKCHVAGLQTDRLPDGVAALHSHITSGSAKKMHCTDCHGGMEHDGPSLFHWERVKRFIRSEKERFKAENRLLQRLIDRACIACHLKDGAGVGDFAYFDFHCPPSYYVTVKAGIRHHEMPPTRTLRRYAVETLERLEKRVER